jgi:hypothetical protein
MDNPTYVLAMLDAALQRNRNEQLRRDCDEFRKNLARARKSVRKAIRSFDRDIKDISDRFPIPRR